MTVEEQEPQHRYSRRRRPRRDASASTITPSTTMVSLSTRNCCTTLLLVLVLLILPLESALAKPGGGSTISLGIRSFLSRPTLLARRDSLSLSSSSSSSTRPVSSTRGQQSLTISVQERYPGADEEEYEALFFHECSDDEQAENNRLAAESAFLLRRPQSSAAQGDDDVYRVRFSYSRKRKQQRQELPETELDLLESSSLSRPRGDILQMVSNNNRVRSITRTSSSPALAPSSNEKSLAAMSTSSSDNVGRGGNVAAAAAAAAAAATRPLLFWESMVCGAVSRSLAQTLLHPANAMKTILQNSRTETIASLMKPSSFHRLTNGAGANFLLSVPHGAINFAVLEFVRGRFGALVASNPALSERSKRLGPTLDFMSSAISTIVCSVVSTPQMMITDNIMAGNYDNLPGAVTGLANRGGVLAFYRGWWPGLVGKIPSYALTWTLFQELKNIRDRLTNHRPATNIENAIMGCLASGTTVTIMIPLDTIKTRLVTQGGSAVGEYAYKGIVDCAVRVAREEGIRTFYRGLPPRLASVVPMIGIQFGVYEAMKKVMLKRDLKKMTPPGVSMQEKESKEEAEKGAGAAQEDYKPSQVFEEAAMEVAASPEQPYPAPQFLKRVYQNSKEKLKQKRWKKVLKVPQ